MQPQWPCCRQVFAAAMTLAMGFSTHAGAGPPFAADDPELGAKYRFVD
jgi:hypothetical protein